MVLLCSCKKGIRLTVSQQLPGDHLLKVPPSLLAQHSTMEEQIWMALNGKVYNVSLYVPFHPGGEKDLLRAAGKDGTKLFNASHPWVNLEGMLEECLVGSSLARMRPRAHIQKD